MVYLRKIISDGKITVKLKQHIVLVKAAFLIKKKKHKMFTSKILRLTIKKKLIKIFI